MKHIIASFCLLLLSASSFCQEQPAPSHKPVTREDYLKLSKTQKTIGFILLGAGAIAIIAVSGGDTEFGTAGAAVIGGGAAILASIPLFIAAGRNKRKAMKISATFQVERNPTLQLAFVNQRPMPALGIKLRF